MTMEQFVCISRDYRSNDIDIIEIGAEDEEAAWEYVEEYIQGNMTQDWLFTKTEWDKFRDKVATFGKIQETAL